MLYSLFVGGVGCDLNGMGLKIFPQQHSCLFFGGGGGLLSPFLGLENVPGHCAAVHLIRLSNLNFVI